MNELKDWSCEFAVGDKPKLTVGQKFSVWCRGTTPLEVTNSEVLVFPNDDKVKYDFVILKSEIKSPHELVLLATTWKPGKKNYKDYTIVIDNNVIDLNGPSFNVKSLLKKDTKVNPPPGPAGLKIPPYAKYVGILFFVLLVVYIIYWFKKNRKYDSALVKLYSLKSSLSPFYELNKQLRNLEVKLSALENQQITQSHLQDLVLQLKESLINYVSLTLYEPLFIFSHKKQLKILKSKLPKNKRQEVVLLYDNLCKEIVNLEKDLLAEKNLISLGHDIFDLIDQTKEFADALIAVKGWDAEQGGLYA